MMTPKPKRRIKNKVILTNRQHECAVTEQIQSLIRRAVRATLEIEIYPLPAEVSVTLVNDAKIHVLNNRFRAVDRPTDVLSFPMEDDEVNIEGRVMLGDIVISLERAREQAEQYGHSLAREVAFLTVHSMLHLLGYDHETSEADEHEMFARQEIILGQMGLVRE